MHNSENTVEITHALPNYLSVSQDGPVTLLRLSRPTKRNALDRNMIADIEAFFRSPPARGRQCARQGSDTPSQRRADLSRVRARGCSPGPASRCNDSRRRSGGDRPAQLHRIPRRLLRCVEGACGACPHSSPFSKAFGECAKGPRVRSMPLLSIKSCRTRQRD